MSFLSAVQGEERAILEKYFLPVQFPRNACILREGDPGDGCFIIDDGTGLTPSFTLGCGTFGGNSTADNVTYTHLLNIRGIPGCHTDALASTYVSGSCKL